MGYREAHGVWPKMKYQRTGSLARRWPNKAQIMHAAWLDGVMVSAGTSSPT